MDISSLSNQVELILRQCAETCILRYFGQLHEDQIQTKTSATDIVTIADQKAEAFLTEKLLPLTPGSIILGEEGYAADPETIKTVRQSDYIWIVDPLDGTAGFRDKTDIFCTMVSLIHSEEIVGAWIDAPRLNKFAAWEIGQSVTINGIEIHLDRQEKHFSEMALVSVRSYKHPATTDKVEANAQYMVSRTPMVSIGVDFISLMENNLDVIFFCVDNPWDISCGAAMINALGGKALKITGANVAGDELFTTKGAFFAMRSPDQWEETLDILLHDIDRQVFLA